MKWLVALSVMVATGVANADDFRPHVLQISAPFTVNGNTIFRNHVDIPFEVNMPSTVSLMIYTDYGQIRLEDVRRGDLSWRYVNKIDTCVYVSAPINVDAGQHTVSWDGTMHNGEKVPMTNDLRYFLWGYANDAAPEPAALVMPAEGETFTTVTVYDEAGLPLDRPFITTGGLESGMPDLALEHVRYRWVIGNDPHDASLLETSSYDAWNDNGPMCFDPVDFSCWIYATQSPGDRLYIRKMIWVPNGKSLMTDSNYTGWEVELPSTAFTGGNYVPVALDGDKLYVVTRNGEGSGRTVTFHVLNTGTGNMIDEVDISAQWLVPEEPAGGGFFGPADISADYRDPSWIMLSSARDCIRQVIDPLALSGDAEEFTRWYLNEDDCAGMAAQSHVSHSQWSFTVDRTVDSNFTLRGPDGYPFGPFPLADGLGEDRPLFQIDYGSAYDGLYVAREPSDISEDDKDFLPEGMITGGWDYLPMDYATGVIQVDYSYFKIEKPNGGEVIPGGSEYEITWDSYFMIKPGMGAAANFEITYTIDGGYTWKIADGKEGGYNTFYWNVPNVDSDQCRIRIIWSLWEGNREFSDEPFTIMKQTGVDGPSPATFTLAQNVPNPFNPTTSISYTLPEAAKVRLTIYSALGTTVGTIVDEWQPAGSHTVEWVGSGQASGVYFYRLDAGGYTDTKRMVLVK